MKQVKIPTLQELARICQLADPTMKAWVCCQKDSGLPMFDLLSLTYSDIKEQIERETVPVHICIHHKMTPMLTNTFFGPNAITALQENYQEKNGKLLFDIRPKILQNRLKKLGLKAQVSTEESPLTAYSLRKFFYIEMLEAGVVREVIEHWMGHSQPSVKGLFAMSVKDMAEFYMRAYPRIDIGKVHAVNTI